VRLRIANACTAGIRRALRAILRLRHILQLALLLSAGLLVACSTQPSVLAMIFDIPPPGQDQGDGPVIHAPRRIPFVDQSIPTVTKEYQALMDEREKEGPPPIWSEVFKKLPKDDDDNIDWIAAWEKKLINPSAGIDPNTPEGKTMDAEVELSTSGKPERMVVFSHATHTKWLACANCHPAIFQKDAGTAKITMDAIDDGKYCGVCHDKVAIAPDGCKGCHKVKSKDKSKKS
jgi:c(7)-type cytochrome triheme protein